MIQTTLCVPLEVKPESASRLSSLIDKFKEREDTGYGDETENFARLSEDLPSLHFLSMSVFEDQIYDPIFIIEANFDGPPGPFWGQFEGLAGNTVREMLRCCKKPLDHAEHLYTSVTEPNSRAPVAPYLEDRTQTPSVYHHGNRGLTRNQILDQAKLFSAIREELDAPSNQGPEPYRAAEPKQFWQSLRQKMVPDHEWLEQPSPPRITKSQTFSDTWRLLTYVAIVLFIFSLPGTIAAVIFPLPVYLILIFLLAALAYFLWKKMKDPLPGTGVKTDFDLIKFIKRSIYTIVFIVAPTLLLFFMLNLIAVYLFDLVFNVLQDGGQNWWLPVIIKVSLGLLGMIVTIPTLILWLRFNERRDSSQYEPPMDEEILAQMSRHEDWVSQNHMGSLVHIRPGLLRMFIVKLGHRGLGLLLRVTATNGMLGSMRTVHFAHWAFLNNNSRLLFFSNFDQSWGAYLDDFIEKAHVGLTLAWGCGVGFPPTRFLIFDGASHGRLFKNWALASRAVSRFWYSAYPELSVDQIERNHRVAIGLQNENMTKEEIQQWMREL